MVVVLCVGGVWCSCEKPSSRYVFVWCVWWCVVVVVVCGGVVVVVVGVEVLKEIDRGTG